jgi:hypothetical protein
MTNSGWGCQFDEVDEWRLTDQSTTIPHDSKIHSQGFVVVEPSKLTQQQKSLFKVKFILKGS